MCSSDLNAIIEIRAGTGGLEATLFVADLYKMYDKVCLKKNWSSEIINKIGRASCRERV